MDDLKRLKELRLNIDDVDDKILELLNKRASLVIDVGKIKLKGKRDFHAPEREKEIYQRLSSNNKGPFPNQALKNVFREIMSASLSLEKPLNVAYLGPKATFTHQACMQYFGLSAECIPQKDIADVFDDVERVKVDYGVVPIEDHINNFTRFLVIGKKSPEKSGEDKTSIMFAIKDIPGALYKMLKPFAERGINMTKIESRPQKGKAWEYIFFVDMDGHISDAKVSEALGELETQCSFLKILGAYPKGGTK